MARQPEDDAGLFIQTAPSLSPRNPMDRILPPDPTKTTVVYSAVAPRRVRGRSIVAGVFALAAVYLAFAVGTPWLLRDAPPDSYAVVANQAACPGSANPSLPCGPVHP